MPLSSEDVLFVGKNAGVVPWYRTGMPAFYLGCDWICLQGRGYKETFLSASLKRGGHSIPKLDDYKIVVLQQVEGRDWRREIKRLKRKGVKVIYEVDDYLHGVQDIQSHRAREVFNPERLIEFEVCMRACDAMICSTEWLAAHYAKFNPNTYVCKNGVETRRYMPFNLPERKTLNIGWAGGEGHLESVMEWIPAVEKILAEFEHTRFISIGLPVANLLKQPKRAVALPFISLENFPGALCNFDIGIAPAGKGTFFQAKSDLRFLETGALGIPLVADPMVYDDIIPGSTGYWAENADDAEKWLRALVEDRGHRSDIAKAAREHVLQNRAIDVVVDQWEKVFIEVAS